MRRVFRYGAIGALPGLLVGLVPLLLHEVGVITSDQSQIGFIGVPLLFIGVFVGTLAGASDTGYGGKVMLGVAAGFVVGLGGGLLIDAALTAAGATVAGLWLLLAPAAMIAGGVLGARWGEHGGGSHTTAAQH
jgi:hypothetical protein